jgi:hypothetical protein
LAAGVEPHGFLLRLPELVDAPRCAQHRLGELIAEQKATEGLAKGGAEKGVGRRGSKNAIPEREGITVPTLAAAGISHKMSSAAQKLAKPL